MVELVATVKNASIEEYDRVSAAFGVPPGLLYHVCIPTEGGFKIIETWQSREALEAWNGTDIFQAEITKFPDTAIEILPVHAIKSAVE